MSIKLYVGNLAPETTSDDLNALFAKSGSVNSAVVITERESDTSRGFGFVEMSSQADGDGAVRDLNGKELHGRSLVVNEARPSSYGGGRSNSRSRY